MKIFLIILVPSFLLYSCSEAENDLKPSSTKEDYGDLSINDEETSESSTDYDRGEVDVSDTELANWLKKHGHTESASEINRLDLSHNNLISSDIPYLTKLVNLKELNVRGNRLKGEDFNRLLNETNIEFLNGDCQQLPLREFKLTRIPSRIKSLSLRFNDLSFPGPGTMQLDSLKELNLGRGGEKCPPLWNDNNKLDLPKEGISFNSLEKLDLSATRITDEQLKLILKNTPKLRYLNISDNFKLTDDIGKSIAKLDNLKVLIFSPNRYWRTGNDATITDAFFSYIKDIKSLEKVIAHVRNSTIPNHRLTEKSLDYLAELPNLKELDLGYLSAWSKAMTRDVKINTRILKKFPNLRKLNIAAWSDSDEPDMNFISSMPKLTSLKLTGFNLNYEAAKQLTSLKYLEELQFLFMNIDYDALQILSKICQPRKIHLVYSMGIWNYKNEIESLVTCSNLKEFSIGNPSNEQWMVDAVGKGQQLEVLRIMDEFDTGVSLAPLSMLSNLKTLQIGARLSISNTSAKQIEELSYSSSLETLALHGLKAINSDLTPLQRIRTLKNLSLKGIYSSTSDIDLPIFEELEYIGLTWSYDYVKNKDHNSLMQTYLNQLPKIKKAAIYWDLGYKDFEQVLESLPQVSFIRMQGFKELIIEE